MFIHEVYQEQIPVGSLATYTRDNGQVRVGRITRYTLAGAWAVWQNEEDYVEGKSSYETFLELPRESFRPYITTKDYDPKQQPYEDTDI